MILTALSLTRTGRHVPAPLSNEDRVRLYRAVAPVTLHNAIERPWHRQYAAEQMADPITEFPSYADRRGT